MASMEQQLVDMQTRLAYQEDAIDSLNQTVVDQQQQIDGLQQQIRILREQYLEQSSAHATVDTGSEKPPHY